MPAGLLVQADGSGAYVPLVRPVLRAASQVGDAGVETAAGEARRHLAPLVPIFALLTSGGSALGAFELDDDEARAGAIIRRRGEPDRRVIGLLDADEEDGPVGFDVLIVERV